MINTSSQTIAYFNKVNYSKPSTTADIANDPKASGNRFSDSLALSKSQTKSVSPVSDFKFSGVKDGNGDPIEYLSIPKWFSNFGENLNKELGVSGSSMPDGYFTGGGAGKIKYSTLLQKHYSATMADAGIKSNKEHFYATQVNQESSNTLREGFIGRLKSDPEFVSLANKLGKEIS